MKKTLLFSITSIGLMTLFSCSSSEPIACYLPSTTATSNSPLVPTGTLQLTTPSIGDGATYAWSGPNSFTSTLQNPVISNVTTAMAGEYKVKAVKGICESPEASTTVEIVAPNIPCSPANNTLIVQSSVIPNSITFNSIYTSTSSGSYEIRAGGSGGDLTIEFSSTAAPTPGVYSISSDCPTSFLTNGQVCVSLVFSGNYTVAHSGSVYIGTENGHLTATFCSVDFQIPATTLHASTKVTVQ
jgi:hypothetical protein